jgi:hypothetical protein
MADKWFSPTEREKMLKAASYAFRGSPEELGREFDELENLMSRRGQPEATYTMQQVGLSGPGTLSPPSLGYRDIQRLRDLIQQFLPL